MRIDTNQMIRDLDANERCPECGGCGWTEDYDPQHSAADADGFVLLTCICPAGEEFAELVASEPSARSGSGRERSKSAQDSVIVHPVIRIEPW